MPLPLADNHLWAPAGRKIGAKHEPLAVSFQLQRGTGIMVLGFVRVVDPVPGGNLPRPKQIIDRRHGAPSAVCRCMTVGLGVMAAFGMGLQI